MKKYLLGMLAVAAIAAPTASALAATYAYVNTQGEVRTVEAGDPNTAINTAPGIHMRSGVILLDGNNAALVD
jgi:hypothetical protein